MSGRVRTPPSLDGVMSLCGYLCVLCAVAAVAATVADVREEGRQQAWPLTTAVVEWCDVQRVYSRMRNAGGPQWHIQCDGRVEIAGERVRVSFRSHGVGSEADVQEMRTWVRRHPHGASVRVRYDPSRPRDAVPDPSSMPHAGSRVQGDVTLLLMFGAGAVLLLFGAGSVRRRNAMRSASVASLPPAA
jgi:hypothetical protein